jgi:aminoglycoside 3-N-acetyltransferase
MTVAQKNLPHVTRQDIVRGLAALGLKPGDNVLVHSALSSFGRVEGGPNTVIDALLDAIGPAGTLVFPTFTGDAVISAFLGQSGSVGAVTLPAVANVNLDDIATPREEHIETGIIPKTARRRGDFLKGNHPLYSICAKGPLAAALVEANDRFIFPSAQRKPIYLLGQHGGKALLIGVPHEANSSIHLIAEFAGLEYKIQDKPYWSLTVTEFLAMPRPRQLELIRLHCGMNLTYNLKNRFDRIEGVLQQAGQINIGKVGNSELRLMPIAQMLRLGLEAVKKNPWLLVDKLPAGG